MPAAQAMQGAVRTGALEALPAAQAMQSLGVMEAVVSEYIPAPQGVQLVAPVDA